MSEEQMRYDFHARTCRCDECREKEMERDCDTCGRPATGQVCPLSKMDIDTCLGSESRPFWRPQGHEYIHAAQIIEREARQAIETCNQIHDPDAPIKGMEEFPRRAWHKNRAPKNTAQENKPKPSLIPFDICMEYDEPAYQEGLIKYYRESWRKGFPISEMYDACQRHLKAFFYEMQDYDQDAAKLGIKKHHLAGARFSIACMLQTLRDHPEMDDREELFGRKENV
jgi:hypothetical protein